MDFIPLLSAESFRRKQTTASAESSQPIRPTGLAPRETEFHQLATKNNTILLNSTCDNNELPSGREGELVYLRQGGRKERLEQTSIQSQRQLSNYFNQKKRESFEQHMNRVTRSSIVHRAQRAVVLLHPRASLGVVPWHPNEEKPTLPHLLHLLAASAIATAVAICSVVG